MLFKKSVWNRKVVVSVVQAHWTYHLFLEVHMCMFKDMNVPNLLYAQDYYEH